MNWEPINTAPSQTLIEGRFSSGAVKLVEFKHGVWWYKVGHDFEICSPPKEWKFIEACGDKNVHPS